MEISLEEQVKKELGYDSDLIIDEDDFQKLGKLPAIQKAEEMEKRRDKR